ncbi:hypothetical protein EDC01DRAFT_242522 [Geopyxis carbonaria]|nr:hypothetical protein EDC01DRAFT_242522 [Geopyxis carbonaria]
MHKRAQQTITQYSSIRIQLFLVITLHKFSIITAYILLTAHTSHCSTYYTRLSCATHRIWNEALNVPSFHIAYHGPRITVQIDQANREPRPRIEYAMHTRLTERKIVRSIKWKESLSGTVGGRCRTQLKVVTCNAGYRRFTVGMESKNQLSFESTIQRTVHSTLEPLHSSIQSVQSL